MRAVFIFLITNMIVASSVFADGFHVPTPEAARELIGLEVRMYEDLLKVEDMPIEVEIEFSREVDLLNGELIVRKDGEQVGTFAVNIEKQESTLKESHHFDGYACRLAPSYLVESYLSIGMKGTEDHFYIPLLRFIPDQHIEKKTREASPDFRDKVSKILSRVWPRPKPSFARLSEKEAKEIETDLGDPFKIAALTPWKESLREKGVQLPAGSMILFSPSKITVMNTEDNLQRIDLLIKQLQER